jgi:hypothetical protein
MVYEQKLTDIHYPTGGNDVFVDIGDKSWGVRACQRYFGGIDAAHTLHVGDQFLSAGANDFKVCSSLNANLYGNREIAYINSNLGPPSLDDGMDRESSGDGCSSG